MYIKRKFNSKSLNASHRFDVNNNKFYQFKSFSDGENKISNFINRKQSTHNSLFILRKENTFSKSISKSFLNSFLKRYFNREKLNEQINSDEIINEFNNYRNNSEFQILSPMISDIFLTRLETMLRNSPSLLTSRAKKLGAIRKALKSFRQEELNVTRINFNPEQRNLFGQLFTSSNQKEITYLIGKLNEMLSNGSIYQKELTNHEKKLINDYLFKHNIQIDQLTKQQRKDLIQECKISNQQLSAIIFSMKQVKGAISKDSKEIIKNWMKEHLGRMPNHSEKIQLELLTGLSRNQLTQQLHYHKYDPVVISESSKKLLRNWWTENNGKVPSKEERMLLIQKTGLTYQQLHTQIKLLRNPNKNSNLETSRQIVVDWMLNNKKLFRIKIDEKLDLQNYQNYELLIRYPTRFPAEKLNQTQFNQHSQLSIDLTKQKEIHISINNAFQWMNQPITNNEREELIQLTQLSHSQVTYLISSIRKESELPIPHRIMILNLLKEQNSIFDGSSLHRIPILPQLSESISIDASTLRRWIRRVIQGTSIQFQIRFKDL